MNTKSYDEVYKDLIASAYPISKEQLEEILAVIPMDQRYKKDFYTESTNKVLPEFEKRFFEEIRKWVL